eukprot:1160534-Pelagomonas_calceolata.AAC.19
MLTRGRYHQGKGGQRSLGADHEEGLSELLKPGLEGTDFLFSSKTRQMKEKMILQIWQQQQQLLQTMAMVKDAYARCVTSVPTGNAKGICCTECHPVYLPGIPTSRTDTGKARSMIVVMGHAGKFPTFVTDAAPVQGEAGLTSCISTVLTHKLETRQRGPW